MKFELIAEGAVTDYTDAKKASIAENVASELGVMSMPTFLFFRGGDVIHTLRGADEKALREQVASMV